MPGPLDTLPSGFMSGNSFFNNFGSGPVGGVSAANAAVPAAVTSASNALSRLPTNQSGAISTTAQMGAESSTGSSRTVLPENWLGTANSGLGELLGEYAKGGEAFDTSAYDAASRKRQASDLAMGMAASQNAATDYIARSRQSGASGAGAGLVKAQGILSAQDKAGQAEEERTKYDIQQREAAASHSAQIAQLLGNLRTNYLATLAGKDTTGAGSTASSGSQLSINQAADRSGGGGSSWAGQIPSGMGTAAGVNPFQVNAQTGQFSTPTSSSNLTGPWNPVSFGG